MLTSCLQISLDLGGGASATFSPVSIYPQLHAISTPTKCLTPCNSSFPQSSTLPLDDLLMTHTQSQTPTNVNVTSLDDLSSQSSTPTTGNRSAHSTAAVAVSCGDIFSALPVSRLLKVDFFLTFRKQLECSHASDVYYILISYQFVCLLSQHKSFMHFWCLNLPCINTKTWRIWTNNIVIFLYLACTLGYIVHVLLKCIITRHHDCTTATCIWSSKS